MSMLDRQTLMRRFAGGETWFAGSPLYQTLSQTVAGDALLSLRDSHRPARDPARAPLAALAGVVVSALALGGLVLSYGPGLFGWREVAFRTSIAVAVVTEVVATIALAVAAAADADARWGTD